MCCLLALQAEEADEPLPPRHDLNMPEYKTVLPSKASLAQRALGPTEALTKTMEGLSKPGRRGDKSVRAKLRKEIRDRKAQEHETRLHISKLGFQKLVKDVLKGLGMDHLKMKEQAMRALQTAMEMMIRRLFEDSDLLCRHAGRVTVFPNDMEACLVLRAREGDALADAGLRVLQAPFLARDAGSRRRRKA